MTLVAASWRVVAIAVRAAPRLTGRILAWQLLATGGTVVQLLAIHRLVEAVGTGPTIELGPLRPALALLGGATFVSSLAHALLLELRLLLAEDVGRTMRIELATTLARAELRHLDDPAFHDRLRMAEETIDSRVRTLPWALISTGLGLLGVVAIGLVLARIAPIVLMVMALASLPLLAVGRFKSKLLFAFHYDETPADRRRRYLQAMLHQRQAAPELIAHQVRSELTSRMAGLMAERRHRLHQTYRQRRPAVIAGTLSSVAGLVVALGTMLLLIDRGALSVADAAVATVALNQLRGRIVSLTLGIEEIGQASAFIASLDELDDGLPGPTRPPTQKAPALECLRVDDVSFTYPGSSEPALSSIDLTLHPGRTVAIVGRNGSGKTTLAKLLAGLYPPASGRIRWNDWPLERAIATTDPILAHLFQDFVRYELSILDNIALGDPTTPPSLDRAIEAARTAGADRWIAGLPDGYDTIVSRSLAEGTELSGGQWQALALARAIYRGGEVLVLDEPTAAQDALLEAGFLDRLRLALPRTSIAVISHRHTVVAGADLVLVLDGGRIVERGSPETLLAADGPYAALFGAEGDANDRSFVPAQGHPA